MMIELKNDFHMEIKRGDIYWYSFNDNILPALVVQNDKGNLYSNYTIVVKMNASQKINQKCDKIPTIIWISREEIICSEEKIKTLKENGYVLTSEIYTIKKDLLKHYIGKLSPKSFPKIERGLMVSLGMNEPKSL